MSQAPRRLFDWWREPLFHFALLGSLIFLVDFLVTSTQKDQIVVSTATADFLVRQREELELRTLSAEERQQVISQFVDDEILYKEAYKRGLDRGDSRMRRNLLFKIRGLLAGEVGDPTAEDLRAYFESNRERFRYKATWSIEQVLFSEPASVPDGLNAQLNSGLDPLGVGEDRYNLARDIPNSTQREIVRIFGPTAARTILAIDDDRWHGPVASRLGVNFVRITGRADTHNPTFEEVERYIEGEWRMDRVRERLEQELNALRNDYHIVIEEMEP